jgi:hypothetical protein
MSSDTVYNKSDIIQDVGIFTLENEKRNEKLKLDNEKLKLENEKLKLENEKRNEKLKLDNEQLNLAKYNADIYNLCRYFCR